MGHQVGKAQGGQAGGSANIWEQQEEQDPGRGGLALTASGATGWASVLQAVPRARV